MTRVIRHLQALLTTLVLVTGTLQMAYASGQAPAVDEMVICTGHSAVTIGIDAEGNPTGEIFYCPECASTVLDAVVAPPASTPNTCETLSTLQPPTFLTHAKLAGLIEVHARGPPVLV